MSRVLSSSELEDRARSAYRQGDYRSALDTIKKAVQATAKPTPSQLDLLIASQEKRDDYEGALSNAKMLIRQFGSDPVGYFRSAHVLQKLNRPHAAVKIYERGLKTVPKDHASYPRLQQKHDLLAASLACSTRSDPLGRLPLELVEAILMYLTFRQRMPCLRVCKSWQKLLHSMPQLWTSLDLSQARRQVKTAFVTKCFNLSRHRIQEAWIGHVKNVDPVIAALTKQCNMLCSLTIHHTEPLTQSMLNCFPMATNLSSLVLMLPKISQPDVRAILAGCRQLKSFSCTGLGTRGYENTWEPLPKSLEDLSLEAAQNSSGAFVNLPSIVEHAPGLKSLRVSGWNSTFTVEDVDYSKLARLERLDLGIFFQPISGLPVTLKEFSTRSTEPRRSFYLPRLQILDCADTDAIPLLLWHEGQSPVSHLDSLSVQNSLNGVRDWVSVLNSERLADLRLLTLRQARYVDDDLAPIIAKMTRLEAIDLGTSDITGYGVKHLVANLPRLKKLALRHCNNCSSDAVEWARKQGIEMIIGGDQPAKGRVVRYGQ